MESEHHYRSAEEEGAAKHFNEQEPLPASEEETQERAASLANVESSNSETRDAIIDSFDRLVNDTTPPSDLSDSRALQSFLRLPAQFNREQLDSAYQTAWDAVGSARSRDYDRWIKLRGSMQEGYRVIIHSLKDKGILDSDELDRFTYKVPEAYRIAMKGETTDLQGGLASGQILGSEHASVTESTHELAKDEVESAASSDIHVSAQPSVNGESLELTMSVTPQSDILPVEVSNSELESPYGGPTREKIAEAFARVVKDDRISPEYLAHPQHVRELMRLPAHYTLGQFEDWFATALDAVAPTRPDDYDRCMALRAALLRSKGSLQNSATQQPI